MDKLNFITAGIPIRTKPRTYKQAFDDLEEMGLNGVEIEFVHGVRMSSDNQREIVEFASQKNMILTAHAPYYINLNSKEEEKIEASVQRVVETAQMAKKLGLYSIVFHAAFYMGADKDVVFDKVKAGFDEIMQTLKEEKNTVFVRPETTGKPTQWGDLDEVIKISKLYDNVLPCIDFSHLHARSGGAYNSYDDFSRILEQIGDELGDFALKNFHAHAAGIEYTQKGEVRHLMMRESDFDYKALMKAFKAFDVRGVLVCESPVMEEDAVLLKEYYSKL
ncbi:MAG: TIM barrel protein [Candidatus Gastranaerophilales bacterium]|nr:TIM barrel protein [Candidatus Gastranaerophilales bacterium]